MDMSRELHAGQVEGADGIEENTEGDHLEENECLQGGGEKGWMAVAWALCRLRLSALVAGIRLAGRAKGKSSVETGI